MNEQYVVIYVHVYSLDNINKAERVPEYCHIDPPQSDIILEQPKNDKLIQFPQPDNCSDLGSPNQEG